MLLKKQENQYFTHKCSELNIRHINENVVISGWVHGKRNHGSLLFIDIRDTTGIVQCVITNSDHYLFKSLDDLSDESVVQIQAKVERRPDGTVNLELGSGYIELHIIKINILSESRPLPFSLDQQNVGEELRLKYRFLDLRRPEMQERMRLRASIIKEMRNLAEGHDFIEVQTPLLTSSSPEGARDYLVPSRIHKGKFYALPQSPQQFKQLLMVSGLPKYYQIAPCFRDEDPRSDRAPGAFYQLDMEMSFATQDDIMRIMENIILQLFKKFAIIAVNEQFPRIKYNEAIEKYASDKPDLRNPLYFIEIHAQLFDSVPVIFQHIIERGGKISMIQFPESKKISRNFFTSMNEFTKSIGGHGLGYIKRSEDSWVGSLASILINNTKIMDLISKNNDGAFIFAHVNHNEYYTIASQIRDKIAKELDLIHEDEFRFCWISDFPMYELDGDKIEFSHNPFSMPQGGMDALKNIKPENIVAFQYDLVCNGYEVASGAVRNHSPAIMYKAFELAGYTKEHVNSNFGAMINAFNYGAPPHAGIALGIERIIMLLAGVKNLREIIPFPLNQNAADLMMSAPSAVTQYALNELGIQVQPAYKK